MFTNKQVETSKEMTEFIDKYYDARPQLIKPSMCAFGTYVLPEWCYDIISSLMNDTCSGNCGGHK